jgi:hypothetical protein
MTAPTNPSGSPFAPIGGPPRSAAVSVPAWVDPPEPPRTADVVEPSATVDEVPPLDDGWRRTWSPEGVNPCWTTPAFIDGLADIYAAHDVINEAQRELRAAAAAIREAAVGRPCDLARLADLHARRDAWSGVVATLRGTVVTDQLPDAALVLERATQDLRRLQHAAFLTAPRALLERDSWAVVRNLPHQNAFPPALLARDGELIAAHEALAEQGRAWRSNQQSWLVEAGQLEPFGGRLRQVTVSQLTQLLRIATNLLAEGERLLAAGAEQSAAAEARDRDREHWPLTAAQSTTTTTLNQP